MRHSWLGSPIRCGSTAADPPAEPIPVSPRAGCPAVGNCSGAGMILGPGPGPAKCRAAGPGPAEEAVPVAGPGLVALAVARIELGPVARSLDRRSADTELAVAVGDELAGAGRGGGPEEVLVLLAVAGLQVQRLAGRVVGAGHGQAQGHVRQRVQAEA